MTDRAHDSRYDLAAIIAAAAMIAFQVAGRATRDTLFLGHFGVAALPAMVAASALISIGVAVLSARAMAATSPARFVPPAYAASAGLMLAIWAVSFRAPGIAAIATHLHIAILSPILISGFWTMVSERFDPRTAKRRIGSIAAFGTLGGIAAGLLASRVTATGDVTAMLPALAALHAVCTLAVGVMGAGSKAAEPAPSERFAWAKGVRILGNVSYLRRLAVLVTLGAASATLLDYVFKVQATTALHRPGDLMRVFATFHTGVAIVTFLVQVGITRRALEAGGLANAVGTLPAFVTLGSLGALIFPGLASVAAARGGELVLRSSLFRSAYEVLFSPIPASDRRATKSIIDVGCERVGDIVGASLIRGVLELGLSIATEVLLAVAAVLGILGVWLAYGFRSGYLRALEANLLRRGSAGPVPPPAGGPGSNSPLDLTQTIDLSQFGVGVGFAIEGQAPGLGTSMLRLAPSSPAGSPAVSPEAARWANRIAALRDPDPGPALRALTAPEALDPELVPHALPLLARDELARETIYALRRVAAAHVGQLADFMLNERNPLSARRRVPRVLAICDSPRAVVALFEGLSEKSFEVRVQCGRALVRIWKRAEDRRSVAGDGPAALGFTPERVFAAVLREVDVEHRVWEGQRDLARIDDPAEPPPVGDYLRDRASASLEHVFTLLSLALPSRAVIVAFEGLHTDDPHLRGTALEYLESVLPATIRAKLWSFLEDGGGSRPAGRSRDAILDELMQANASIRINLEEIRRQRGEGEG